MRIVLPDLPRRINPQPATEPASLPALLNLRPVSFHRTNRDLSDSSAHEDDIPENTKGDAAVGRHPLLLDRHERRRRSYKNLTSCAPDASLRILLAFPTASRMEGRGLPSCPTIQRKGARVGPTAAVQQGFIGALCSPKRE
jgi:hypothetical protein